MSSTMTSDQAKLILEHYLDYQRDQERQVTLKEFAALLEIHETTLNLLINDKRQISGRMAVHLAAVLHDNRFLDLINVPHPDPLFSYVSREWPNLLPEQQAAIRDQIAKYRTGIKDDKEPARA